MPGIVLGECWGEADVAPVNAAIDPDDPPDLGAGPAPSRPTLHRSRSAGRVLELLDTVITGGPSTLRDAAAVADMPPSTALRHLRVLTDRGYLVKDGLGRYSVGPTFVRIALAAFQSGPYARLTTAAQPRLEHLASVIEESVYLAVRDGSEAVYIATVESPRAIRHVGWVGRSVPLAGTAVGDALLSESSPAGPAPVFVNTGSIEDDVTAIVAPVCGAGGVIAAISILGPAERFTADRLADASRAVAEAATATALAVAVAEGSDA